MSSPSTPNFSDDEGFVYRAFSRQPDSTGKVTDKDFRLRRSRELTLSIARTPEKAMGDLDCRGYVRIPIAQITKLSLRVQAKTGSENPTNDNDLLEIVGIPIDDEQLQISYALALADAADQTVPVAGHRRKRP